MQALPDSAHFELLPSDEISKTIVRLAPPTGGKLALPASDKDGAITAQWSKNPLNTDNSTTPAGSFESGYQLKLVRRTAGGMQEAANQPAAGGTIASGMDVTALDVYKRQPIRT